MDVVVAPEGSTDRRQAGSVLAIALDLERLKADLDRVSWSDDAVITIAVEDARYALNRAVIAVREVMAAPMTGARPHATVALT